jgi:flagellar motor switch protein FliG
MARQEVIDGPGVAAKILSRFPAEEREHLVAAIRAEAPKVAATLERRIVDFTRVKRIPTTALQNLLREIPHRDIAISLKTAEEPVQQRILENVSESKLEMVKEDLSLLPPMVVTDVEAAQARILKRLEELYPDESNAKGPKRSTSRLA